MSGSAGACQRPCVSTVDVRGPTRNVVIGSDGTTALAATSRTSTVPSMVVVLARHGSSWQVTGTVDVAGDIWDLAITPDATSGLVTNVNGRSVQVLTRTPTGWALTSTLGTGSRPWGVAITPDGASALVAAGTVEVFTRTGDTWARTGTITGGFTAMAVAVAADGSTALVTNNDGTNRVTSVSVLSRAGTTWSVTQTLDVAKPPFSVAIAPDGSRGLVTSGDESGQMWALTRTGHGWKKSQTIALAGAVTDVAIAPDGNTAIATSVDTDVPRVEADLATVLVRDGDQWQTTSVVRLGGSPESVAITPDATSALIARSATGTLSVLRW